MDASRPIARDEFSPSSRSAQSVEQALARLLEAAPDAMAIVDDQGRITATNDQLHTLFGYTREELVGHAVEVLIPERSRDVHRRHRGDFLSAPSRRPMGAGMELHCRRKDGSEFAAEVSLSPIAGIAETRVIAAVRDVTARRQLETRLALSERLASVGTLAGGVAHEINNPLTAVVSNLDLIAAEVQALDAAGSCTRTALLKDLVAEAQEGARRVTKIVRGMGVFARPPERIQERLGLGPVLDTAINLAMPDIRQRAQLRKDLQPTPPVLANETDLVQVFVNLLVNAAQAMPDGNNRRNLIELKVRPEGARVIVEVSDNGVGIPSENLGRIFDPFFTTRPVGGGTGLGLAVCHGIVTASGGDITVTSEPGRGTQVRVSLPSAVSQAAPASPGGRLSTRRAQVLVIDDDTVVAAALQRLLRNHALTVVQDGAEALALLISEDCPAFDVILCDLTMPKMTGMDLYRALAGKRPGVCERMVFMTGGAFTAEARNFLAEVPNRRLDKPWEPQRLRDLVDESVR